MEVLWDKALTGICEQEEQWRTPMPSVASNMAKPKISVGEMWKDKEVQHSQTGDKETA